MTQEAAAMEALNEAIAVAGTARALAQRIGVVQSAVTNWRMRRKVPAEHCPAIERETGVSAERLCPAVDWAVIRGKRPDLQAA